MAEDKTFSLAGKALKLSTAADLSAHTSPLTTNASTIEHINFTGNTLGIEASAELAATLKECTNLRTANFSDIFTGRLLSEIPTALSNLLTALLSCPNLHTIDLSDNAFGLNTVEPLRPFLSQHTPLQHLILNNNGLGPAAGTLVAEALVTLADNKRQARVASNSTAGNNDKSRFPDLETVVCGRNRLETGSMAAWVKAYAAHKNVKTVKMVQNGIRQEGIALLLSQGLSCCSELRVLDLQDNTFTNLAAKTLAGVLPKWEQLVELGVGDCLLGGRGGVNVATVLAAGSNKGLEVLRLQYNEVDARTLKVLAEAVELETPLPRLRRVELNGNKFNEEDPNIEKLQLALAKRKDNAATAFPGVDEEDEEAWGLDELDELEDEDSDEDEEEEAEEEEDAEEAKVVQDAEKAENEKVAQKKDQGVDALADALGKTEIK
ncbi:hypothetical protein MBLNU230_g5293t1 [Neophaeotheca triangularis]